MEPVTVSEAAKLSGLTPGQVSGMIFSKVIEPDIHVPNSSGDHSVLSAKNVRELQLIARLKRAGVKKEVIKGLLQLLAKSVVNSGWWKEGSNSYVVVLNDSWFVTSNPFSTVNVERLSKQELVLIAQL